jgi:Transglycosylase SLT domain
MIRRLHHTLFLTLLLTQPMGLVMARPAQNPAPAATLPAPGPLSPPAMCEAAIAGAEADSRLPARLLTAISLRESGRVDPDTGRVRAWPWTINYEGAGHFYASRDDAIAAVQAIQAAGGQSIDVGCMQVNLMHHPDAFASLEEAFDPKRNAAYAARFVTALFGALGDWGMAIAAYHSRTPGIGEPYRDQVVATWNPTDPAVLAKLSFSPLPPPISPIPGLPTIYVPFAQPGPIAISQNMAYRAFVQPVSAYRSFAPSNVAYADFAGRKPVKQRSPPLDLRVNVSLAGAGRALVVPTGMIVRPNTKPVVAKPLVQRPRESG